MQDETLRIGEVADECGVSRDTLRYWEQEGVIPEPPREDSSGYRMYPEDLVRRIHAVQRAQELGLTLEDIRRIFDRRDRGETCDELGRITEERIAALRKEKERLQRKIEGLQSLGEVCPGELPATECPVVDMLAQG
jgi:MerR family mercuric resistance operon transcriptional regulator